MISQSIEPESSSSKNTLGTTEVAAASGTFDMSPIAAITANKTLSDLGCDMAVLRITRPSLLVEPFDIRRLQNHLRIVGRAGAARSDAIKSPAGGCSLPYVQRVRDIGLHLHDIARVTLGARDIDGAGRAVFKRITRPPTRRLAGEIGGGAARPHARHGVAARHLVGFIHQRGQRGLS